ncbi:MAG: DUF364 domain-containing protein [Salinivirgaceae bacterium]|nr:DUF364 domain-containing protein [Salinivirgaceae bacterium]
MKKITESTIQYLANKIDFSKLHIKKIRIGTYLTAVILSDDSCGVSSTINEKTHNCKKEGRDFGEFTPGKLENRSVDSLLNTSKNSAVIQSLKIATLNALSEKIIVSENYKIIENIDPIDLLDFKTDSKVVIVGGFNSYISKVLLFTKNIHVLEFDKLKISSSYRHFYVDASEYKKTLGNANFVIITGMTLINETIDDLLKNCPKDATTVVTGPSSSIIPDMLFNNNVNLIGSIKITDSNQLFKLVEQAGTAYHLFKYCARKITIINNSLNLSTLKNINNE